jgi:hypothetical protein
MVKTPISPIAELSPSMKAGDVKTFIFLFFFLLHLFLLFQLFPLDKLPLAATFHHSLLGDCRSVVGA